MRVTVHYMAQIKRFAGCASEPVEIRAGSRLSDLLVHLAQRHGDAFRGMLLDESATPRRSLLFFVGEEHAELTRPLHEGDVVTLLAPMAGG
jgi:molybdopterin converting factor small subunit